MKESMLTTIDNPFDPFTQFDEWNTFDEENGYYTFSLLARIANASSELIEDDQDFAIEEAIDEIVRVNASGRHIKVERDNKQELSTD